MAGPDLLIYSKLKTLDLKKIAGVFEGFSNKYMGDDFWVAGQPFIWGVFDPDEDDRKIDLGGWVPEKIISIAAMCNNPASHAFLAAMGVKVADIVDGMILLGELDSITNNEVVLTFSGHIKHEDYGYFVNSAFLSFWVGEREFCLIK